MELDKNGIALGSTPEDLKNKIATKKIVIIILTFIEFASYTNGQDCFKTDYYSSIDTTNRPVFQFVEKMPEILNGEFIRKILPCQSQLFDSVQVAMKYKY